MKRLVVPLAGLLGLVAAATPSRAVVIDVTGGTVTLLGGATATTGGGSVFQGVDFYEEGGAGSTSSPTARTPSIPSSGTATGAPTTSSTGTGTPASEAI